MCQTGPEGVWNLTRAVPLWSLSEKTGQVPKPFWNQFGPFHFGKKQTWSKWVWNLTLAVPCWSVLENRTQVPNPFEIILVPFVLEGAELVTKGFGT